MLLESFVDERAHAGTSYRAANWQRLGETAGRGRQDRYSACAAGRKAIHVLPLTKDLREALSTLRARPLRLAPAPREDEDWAAYEFGRVDVVDGRLRERSRWRAISMPSPWRRCLRPAGAVRPRP